MNAVEHNNATSGPPVSARRASTIVTLADVISLIKASEEIPADRKRYLCSALNRANVLLADGHADVRADPRRSCVGSTGCPRPWPT
jgi:prepilin-type processing-associated H-X9-DG protein